MREKVNKISGNLATGCFWFSAFAVFVTLISGVWDSMFIYLVFALIAWYVMRKLKGKTAANPSITPETRHSVLYKTTSPGKDAPLQPKTPDQTSDNGGYVYLLEREGYYKIGMTRGSVEKRARSMRTGSPHPITIVHKIYCDDRRC